jgi:hypothetical protein
VPALYTLLERFGKHHAGDEEDDDMAPAAPVNGGQHG